MNASLISTVFNEEEKINDFLSSIFSQKILPSEIVIVDAYSTDNTYNILKKKIATFLKSNKKIKILLLQKKGNRSIGRNYAIVNCTNMLIAATDAGCMLDNDWLKNILAPFSNNAVDVVAGFYKPIATTVFEKCLAAYTCIMEDKVNADFLPSSRSIAFKKSVWKEVGGYPEQLDFCEDLVFAKKIKSLGFKFKVCKNAIVYWQQKKNAKEAFVQFFNYARGDGAALYIRPQTPLLFGRYIIGLLLLFLCVRVNSASLIIFFTMLILGYLIWSICKNYKYVNKISAVIIFPFLQIESDIAVLIGTVIGILSRR